MVIVNKFTKMVRLKATITNVSSEEITKVYRDEIWKLHEILRKILSDKRLQFASRFIKKFTKALKTTRQLLTVYHPQTDRQTERINQEVRTFLQHYVNYQQCYKLRSLGLDNRTTLILSNTRELDRKLFYKLVYLI